MLLVFYLIVLVKMMLVFIPKEISSRHVFRKTNKKNLSSCFLTCAVRHAFNAIILFYRSHSPIAKT